MAAYPAPFGVVNPQQAPLWLTAVLQLVYRRVDARKWIFPQEKTTLQDFCHATGIGEPL
jgi:hypothetical protein